MRKMSVEDFIARAGSIHQLKYDYSFVSFDDSNDKVDIQCKQHNEKFSQTVVSHLSGRVGCKKCYGSGKSQENFIHKAAEKHGDRFDYSSIQYTNRNTSVEIRCIEHDYKFNILTKSHLAGDGGCKYCLRKSKQNIFIAEVEGLYQGKYDYSGVEYVNRNTKISIRCNIHNITFQQTPAAHLSNRVGCKICIGENVKAACMAKYDVENPFQSDIIKERIKQTNLGRYGFEHAMQSPVVKAKSEQTCMVKYGVPFVLQDEQIKVKSKKTKRLKYGDENYNNREGAKHTCLEKYNVSNISNVADVKTRKKNTFMERYNVEHALQYKPFVDKFTGTMLERYNVEHALQYKPFVDKFTGTMLERYNVEHSGHINFDEKTLEKLNDEDWLRNEYTTRGNSSYYIASLLNVTPKTVIDRIHNFNIPLNESYMVSSIEMEIRAFIKDTYNGLVVCNSRDIISPLELDIYIPEIGIAIEVNGRYWHSELNGKDRNYHINKTLRCEDVGITLVHIWDYEWEGKNAIVKSFIRGKLNSVNIKYDARKCKICKISQQAAVEFLNRNHLQGGIFATYRYGLVFNDELVAVATFSKSRFNKNVPYELIRYANKMDSVVRGGIGKIVAAFKREHIGDIITYADKSKFSGNGYTNIGFTYTHTSKPSFKYTKHGNIFSREKFQKHKLSKILEVYSASLSGWVNMKNNNYDRIWDCGNNVYILTRNKK